MKNTTIIILSLIMIFIAGCAGSKKASGMASLNAEASSEILKNIPEWYSQQEQKPNITYGKGEGVSNSKSIATRKAKMALRVDFQAKTKSIVSQRVEDFAKETGEDADSEVYLGFEEINTSIMEGSVENWYEVNSTTVIEKSVAADGRPKNMYRHYILAAIDQAAADKRLLEKIKRDKELRTAFEQTKAYDKMTADLERYKDKLDY
mgnify:CR=1 FL=1